MHSTNNIMNKRIDSRDKYHVREKNGKKNMLTKLEYVKKRIV